MKTKKVFCSKCNGNGWFSVAEDNKTYAQQCPVCSGTGYIEVPFTNSDLIRNMSDEALAHYLEHGFDCIQCSEYNYSCCSKKCFDRCLEWLKKPMEG